MDGERVETACEDRSSRSLLMKGFKERNITIEDERGGVGYLG